MTLARMKATLAYYGHCNPDQFCWILQRVRRLVRRFLLFRCSFAFYLIAIHNSSSP
ncbi:hypothetical protein M513_14372 [Trichuris suis]|uniref:Uncharacterized protein n=1 Tax=Trichuris suis TaxID=68888 RepID=A0A085LIF5_9BILA|nr:hypothetical protein M513_14372 [Trichuris suis]